MSDSKSCPAIAGTVSEFVNDFCQTLCQASGLEETPLIREAMVAAAVMLLFDFITRRAHIANQHSGSELSQWGLRIFEECRLLVTAFSTTGLRDVRLESLLQAAPETAYRVVVGGEQVLMKLEDDGWKVYGPTTEELARAQAALASGQDTIQITQEESKDESFLQGWTPPATKAN